MLRWFIFSICMLLVACAHVPGPGSGNAAALADNARDWQLSGRFAAGQEVANASLADSPDPVAGRFAWQHQGNNDTLWLLGPIGNTMAKIDVTPTGVRWQDANGRRGEAANLYALGESLAGIRLPDVAADSWLRGRWAKSSVRSRDEEGRVLVAGAAGWVFQYRYGAPAPGQWPLAIEGAGPNGLWLRVALTEWDGLSDPADRPAP